ncbi:hypothetical protein A6E01_19165 (plasmid) [Vibrio breoganii]|uniref:Uncharacterized protein n=1 Tax=Vibrio breoganii TaxID=553239 RepID=A0AAN0XZ80_9VIBR|nr:hypothetical protein [Vibrio breoganii]ANO35335.1 hypothetical protein A6E01_19165 [Vibrio breoganii]PML12743.1 hypothetical protein BCT84_02340 [Vibrio breoganii]
MARVSYTLHEDLNGDVGILEFEYEDTYDLPESILMFPTETEAELHMHFMSQGWFYNGSYDKVRNHFIFGGTEEGIARVAPSHTYHQQFREWLYSKASYYVDSKVESGIVDYVGEYEIDTYKYVNLAKMRLVPVRSDSYFLFSFVKSRGPVIFARFNVSAQEAQAIVDKHTQFKGH